MTLNALITELRTLNVELDAPERAGQGEPEVAWTPNSRAGVYVVGNRIRVLDRDGTPCTQDGSGWVADARAAAREIRRLGGA